MLQSMGSQRMTELGAYTLTHTHTHAHAHIGTHAHTTTLHHESSYTGEGCASHLLPTPLRALSPQAAPSSWGRAWTHRHMSGFPLLCPSLWIPSPSTPLTFTDQPAPYSGHIGHGGQSTRKVPGEFGCTQAAGRRGPLGYGSAEKRKFT